ncbi:MAG: biotin--[acetyl-CoA-carboxylase] ligase [Oscillospiraceae bacterium]|nr:biotin--[acetyl-CoA-carboxylase] ligase [Candidatus Equicaccousia limihippi]
MPSSYLYAKDNADNLPDRFAVISKIQTKGVGRTGKTFISNSKNGVYFTFIIKNADNLPHLTCAAAVTAVRVIKKFFNKDTQIKWVNDIMFDNKKVCGILAGFAGDAKYGTAVLGIGLNLAPPRGGFAAEISDIAGAVQKKARAFIKAEFIAEYLNEFDRIYREKQDFMQEYAALSYNVGKKARFVKDGKTVNGICTAVNGDGSLTVISDDKEYNLTFGEVSVKPF